MNKYAWIRPGVKCHWIDPCIKDFAPEERENQLNMVFEIVNINRKDDRVNEDDDIVLISNGNSEAEVLPSELIPFVPNVNPQTIIEQQRDLGYLSGQADAILDVERQLRKDADKKIKEILRERKISRIDWAKAIKAKND